VIVEDVGDAAVDDHVDAAYRAKYRRYAESIIDSITSPEARSTTLKLIPERATPPEPCAKA
jgi:hypothetical protein